MQDVWNAVRIGADSYLQRQLRTILPAVGLLTIALFLSVYVVPPSHEAVEELERKTPNHRGDWTKQLHSLWVQLFR